MKIIAQTVYISFKITVHDIFGHKYEKIKNKFSKSFDVIGNDDIYVRKPFEVNKLAFNV